MVLTEPLNIFSLIICKIICGYVTCKINRIKHSHLKLSRIVEGKLLADFAAIRNKCQLACSKMEIYSKIHKYYLRIKYAANMLFFSINIKNLKNFI